MNLSMIDPFPQSYASPLHLPFNRACLDGRLQLQSPDGDPGDDEPLWAIRRGSELLVPAAGPVRLWRGALPDGLAEREGWSIHIGTWDRTPCRALSLSAKADIPEGLRAEDLLAAQPGLPIELLSLGGLAGQILHWQRLGRYCSLCGAQTEAMPGEWGRCCSGCGHAHFPHIHPCAIVLVRREGEVLLTRKAEWPAGRYSLVAGFLDFGEALEEAAAREVLEETGVQVANLRYVGSQGWPFPSQLMAGFVADYAGGEVQVEEQELEDARWFPVDDLPLLPPRRSIARYLLDNHLQGA